MTPKQRIQSAFRFEQPDDLVPFMEIEFHIFDDFIGRAPVMGFEFAALSSAEKEKAYYRNAEILIETAEKAGHDAIKEINNYWETAPGVPAYFWLPDDESRLEQIRVLKKLAGEKYFILGQVGATMAIPDGNQISDFVYDLYENREELKARFEKLLQDALEYQKRAIDAGVDGIINASDVAFNNGPFISPTMMDEVFFPYFNRWVESLKKEKIVSIWHTDGNISILMDRVYESGVDAIQCIDPLAGMDIVTLSEKTKGLVTLIGNIDCSLLQNGTPAEIDATVKNVVENCKAGGGFVLSGCNAIFKGISAENYRTMVEARKRYGRYI